MPVQLDTYIDAQLKKGFSKEEVKLVLLKTGWRQEDIDASFANLRPSKDLKRLQDQVVDKTAQIAGNNPEVKTAQVTPGEKTETNDNKEFPFGEPWLHAILGLLSGIGYITLRSYGRFMIFWILLVITYPIIPFSTPVLLIAAAIDTFLTAKRLKLLPNPKFSIGLTILCIVLLIIGWGLIFLSGIVLEHIQADPELQMLLNM